MRLTDKRIAELTVFGGNIATSRESAAELREMAQEIRERRAADLAAEDIEQMRRVCDVARRVVSRAIHRRQGHQDVLSRHVELLPLDIEILAKLADAVHPRQPMRLTDDELDEALEVAQSMNSLRLTAAVSELKERRAQDLTTYDVDILSWLRRTLADESFEPSLWETSISVLDKLLTRGNR